MNEEIRWGILGLGFIAGSFASDLTGTHGARLTAVASRSVDRARDFASRHGVDRYYGDYTELAEDPEIDVVYVASPQSHHYAHARLLLEHGKAVVVEKPLTLSAIQAQELVELARARGLFLMEAMWTLCNPVVRDLVALVRAGAIGAPRSFSASLGPIGGVPRGHRIEDPELGGSYLLECLVYPLSLLTALAPELADPQDLTCAVVLSERGVDTASSVTIASRAGFASMSGGFAAGSDGAGRSTFHLIGTDGWIQVEDNIFNPAHVRVSSRGKPVELLSDPRSNEGFRWEIEEVGRCLRNRELESPLVPLDHTIHVMSLLDRSRAAAGMAQW